MQLGGPRSPQERSGSGADDDFAIDPLDLGRGRSAGSGPFARVRVPQKLTRPPIRRLTLLSVWILAVALLVVISSSGLAEDLWSQAKYTLLRATSPTFARVTIVPHSPATLTSSGWEQIPLPVPTKQLRWYAPAPNSPGTIYGCSGAPFPQTGDVQEGPLQFWRTQDSGQHWTPVGLPDTTGLVCSGSVAPDVPRQVALLAVVQPDCVHYNIFLSADAGLSWRRASTNPPAPSGAVSCGVDTWVTAHHLYVFQTFEPAPSDGRAASQASAMFGSDDGGRTWKQLDDALDSGEDVFPMQLADGESMLVGESFIEGHDKGGAPRWATRLWATRDAGSRWQPIGTVSGYDGASLVWASGVRSTSPTLTQPFYMPSLAETPWYYFEVQIAQIYDQRWALLPPLPVAGASAEHLGITDVLGETPAGKLLVFGIAPQDPLPVIPPPVVGGQSTPPQLSEQWLWEWDPRAARWVVIAPPLPHAWPQCAAQCWGAAFSVGQGPKGVGTYVWVSGGGLDGSTGIFRMILPRGA
jgi:hypothetical protein